MKLKKVESFVKSELLFEFAKLRYNKKESIYTRRINVQGQGIIG